MSKGRTAAPRTRAEGAEEAENAEGATGAKGVKGAEGAEGAEGETRRRPGRNSPPAASLSVRDAFRSLR